MTNARDLNTIAERYSRYGVIKEELITFVEQGLAKGYDEKTFLFMIDRVFFLVLVQSRKDNIDIKALQDNSYEEDYNNFINGEYLKCGLSQEEIKQIQESI